jgi:hypothetical protein
MFAKILFAFALFFGLDALTSDTRGGVDPWGNPTPEADESDVRGGVDPWG